MHLMQRAPPAHWKHFDSTLGPFSRAIAFSIPDPVSCNAISISKFKHKQLSTQCILLLTTYHLCQTTIARNDTQIKKKNAISLSIFDSRIEIIITKRLRPSTSSLFST